MKIFRKIYLSFAVASFLLFPSFVQAFNLPKAKLVRVDKPVVLLPLESYKVSYQNDIKVLSKLSLGDDEYSQEKILDLIKQNNIKLSCDKKLLLKISKDKCTELKVATYFLNKQLLEGAVGHELKGKTDIKFPLGVLNGNFYYYTGFEQTAIIFILSGKNEFYIYFGLNKDSLKLLEAIKYPSGKDFDRIMALAADENGVYLIDGVKISVIKGLSTDLVKVTNPVSPTYDIVSFSHPFSDSGNFYYFVNDKLFYFKSSLSSGFDTVFVSIFKDDNKVFIQGKKGEVWEIVGADVKSFSSFSHYGAEGSIFDYFDTNNIYVEGRDGLYKIDLSKYSLVGKYNYPSIIKNGKEVIYFNKKGKTFNSIPGADAKTFEVLPEFKGVLYADSKYIYLRSGDLSVKRLSSVDRKSFTTYYDPEFSNSSVLLFKDKKGYYAVTKNLDGDFIIKKLPSQLNTTVIYNGYGVTVSKDAKNVYVSSLGERNILSGADPLSFVLVEDGVSTYGRDNNSIYIPTGCINHKLTKLSGADQSTFKVIKVNNWNYFGQDKNNVWYYDKKVCAPVKINGATTDSFNFEEYLNKVDA